MILDPVYSFHTMGGVSVLVQKVVGGSNILRLTPGGNNSTLVYRRRLLLYCCFLLITSHKM